MIFASNNKNKLKQIEILCQGKIDITGLKESGIDIEVEENGKTFEENAVKKAKAIFEITHSEVLADDSGLCIDFFEGWPGVYTHRFLPNSTSEQRNDAIIEKMQNVDEDLRGARAVCVLAYVNKNGEIKTFKGEVKGKIGHQQKGENLFGFDPIFVLPIGKTLAELDDNEKLNYNARSKAFEKFLKEIVLTKK